MSPLHLFPTTFDLTVDVTHARAALEAYWGEPRGTGLAAQGPDYYEASCGHPRRDQSSSEGGVVALPGASTPHALELGDISWAVLLAGQPRPQAAQAVLNASPTEINLPDDVPLANANDDLLDRVTDLIWTTRAKLHYVHVAIAVKMFHPKRPSLIPVLDNQNFFGSYQRYGWRLGDAAPSRRPQKPALRAGLEAVRRVVADPVNDAAWTELDDWIAPDGAGPFPRVVLFDMLWWALRHGAKPI